MLVFLGDLHGTYAAIDRLRSFLGPDDIVVQVGDFGFYEGSLRYWVETPFKVYAIDGNHEDYRIINPDGKVAEVRRNLYYVPRGTVLELAGKTVAFLGGGASIDKASRTEGVDWFRQEEITESQVARLREAMTKTGPVDFLVTHTPGKGFIKSWFPPLNLQEWGLPPDWTDPSAVLVDGVVKAGGFGMHLCGHMHRSVWDGTTRCLDINEVYVTNV